MAQAAKNEKAPEESKKKTFADIAAEKLGDDFVNDTQPSIDGWYKPVAGDGFYGRVIGNFQIEDKKAKRMRDVVIVRLGVECNAVADKKSVKLAEGQCLGVSIRHKLLPLMEHITNKNVVYVKALEQKPIGNGQSMWEFDIKSKGIKAPPPEPRVLTHDQAAAGGVVGDDDIPF